VGTRQPLFLRKTSSGHPAADVLESGMEFELNLFNILAGIIFGIIGWGAYSYGKKLELWQPRAIGLALMIYPYFIYNKWLVWIVGVALLVLLWFYHHE
jgi:hypothetical protein